MSTKMETLDESNCNMISVLETDGFEHQEKQQVLNPCTTGAGDASDGQVDEFSDVRSWFISLSAEEKCAAMGFSDAIFLSSFIELSSSLGFISPSLQATLDAIITKTDSKVNLHEVYSAFSIVSTEGETSKNENHDDVSSTRSAIAVEETRSSPSVCANDDILVEVITAPNEDKCISNFTKETEAVILDEAYRIPHLKSEEDFSSDSNKTLELIGEDASVKTIAISNAVENNNTVENNASSPSGAITLVTPKDVSSPSSSDPIQSFLLNVCVTFPSVYNLICGECLTQGNTPFVTLDPFFLQKRSGEELLHTIDNMLQKFDSPSSSSSMETPLFLSGVLYKDTVLCNENLTQKDEHAWLSRVTNEILGKNGREDENNVKVSILLLLIARFEVAVFQSFRNRYSMISSIDCADGKIDVNRKMEQISSSSGSTDMLTRNILNVCDHARAVNHAEESSLDLTNWGLLPKNANDDKRDELLDCKLENFFFAPLLKLLCGWSTKKTSLNNYFGDCDKAFHTCLSALDMASSFKSKPEESVVTAELSTLSKLETKGLYSSTDVPTLSKLKEKEICSNNNIPLLKSKVKESPTFEELSTTAEELSTTAEESSKCAEESSKCAEESSKSAKESSKSADLQTSSKTKSKELSPGDDLLPKSKELPASDDQIKSLKLRSQESLTAVNLLVAMEPNLKPKPKEISTDSDFSDSLSQSPSSNTQDKVDAPTVSKSAVVDSPKSNNNVQMTSTSSAKKRKKNRKKKRKKSQGGNPEQVKTVTNPLSPTETDKTEAKHEELKKNEHNSSGALKKSEEIATKKGETVCHVENSKVEANTSLESGKTLAISICDETTSTKSESTKHDDVDQDSTNVLNGEKKDHITVSRVEGFGTTIAVAPSSATKMGTGIKVKGDVNVAADTSDETINNGDSEWETVEVRGRGNRKKSSDRSNNQNNVGRHALHLTSSKGHERSNASQVGNSGGTSKKTKSSRTSASRKRVANRKMVRDIISSVLDVVDEEIRKRTTNESKNSSSGTTSVILKATVPASSRHEMSRPLPRKKEAFGAHSVKKEAHSLRDVVVRRRGNNHLTAAKQSVATGLKLTGSKATSTDFQKVDRVNPDGKNKGGIFTRTTGNNIFKGKDSNNSRNGPSPKRFGKGNTPPGADQNTAPTVPETLSAVSANSVGTDVYRVMEPTGKCFPSNELPDATRSDSSSTDNEALRKHNCISSPQNITKDSSLTPPLPTLLSPGNVNSSSSSVASSLEAPHASHSHHHSGTANEKDVGYHLLDVCERLTRDTRIFMSRRALALSARRRERGALLGALQESVASLWPSQCRVEMYGSCATQLDLPSSDLDVVVCGLHTNPTTSPQRVRSLSFASNGSQSNHLSPENRNSQPEPQIAHRQQMSVNMNYMCMQMNAERVLRLASKLECLPWAVHVKAIPTASVPVVKVLADPSRLSGSEATPGDWRNLMSQQVNSEENASNPTGAFHSSSVQPIWRGSDVMNGLLSLDITFEGPEHGGIGSTEFSAHVVQEACSETNQPPENTPIVQVVMVLKELLAQRRLNEPFSGGLSSYALLLLVLAVVRERSIIREELERVERQRKLVFAGGGNSVYNGVINFDKFSSVRRPDLSSAERQVPSAKVSSTATKALNRVKTPLQSLQANANPSIQISSQISRKPNQSPSQTCAKSNQSSLQANGKSIQALQGNMKLNQHAIFRPNGKSHQQGISPAAAKPNQKETFQASGKINHQNYSQAAGKIDQKITPQLFGKISQQIPPQPVGKNNQQIPSQPTGKMNQQVSSLPFRKSSSQVKTNETTGMALANGNVRDAKHCEIAEKSRKQLPNSKWGNGNALKAVKKNADQPSPLRSVVSINNARGASLSKKPVSSSWASIARLETRSHGNNKAASNQQVRAVAATNGTGSNKAQNQQPKGAQTQKKTGTFADAVARKASPVACATGTSYADASSRSQIDGNRGTIRHAGKTPVKKEKTSEKESLKTAPSSANKREEAALLSKPKNRTTETAVNTFSSNIKRQCDANTNTKNESNKERSQNANNNNKLSSSNLENTTQANFPQGFNDIIEVLCSGETTTGKLLMHCLLFYGQHFDAQQTAIDISGKHIRDGMSYRPPPYSHFSPYIQRRTAGIIDPVTGMLTVDPIIVYDPLEGAENNNVAKRCFLWSSVRWVFAQSYMTLSSAVERSVTPPVSSVNKVIANTNNPLSGSTDRNEKGKTVNVVSAYNTAVNNNSTATDINNATTNTWNGPYNQDDKANYIDPSSSLLELLLSF